MKTSEYLTPRQWDDLLKICNTYTNDFLFNAINETMQQQGLPILVVDETKQISHEALVKITIQLIQETNTCDDDGLHIWIDPQGKYKIPIEKKTMIIKNLPIGTKLMWDAPPNHFVDPYKQIIYPAIVVQRHWNKQMVLIKAKDNSKETANWMGPESEYLRYPTAEELSTYSWPNI